MPDLTPRRHGALSLVVLVADLLLWPSLADKCPVATEGLKSGQQKSSGAATELTIESEVAVPVDTYWVNFEGKDINIDQRIDPGELTSLRTYVGHTFRVYTVAGKELLKEFTVARPEEQVQVKACGSIKKAAHDKQHARAEEMKSLIHDMEWPCAPQGKSSLWSCVHKTSKMEYLSRPGAGKEYGFANEKEASGRGIGTRWDFGYVQHMKRVPRVANTSGFLKMSFTKTLKEVLMPFYKEHCKGCPKDAVTVHEPIAGGYTNSHVVKLSKLDLDRFRHIQQRVQQEMKAYLEWWTGQPLQHTSTFGIRIYHRGSMLIDHVDRADTHLASAVIQLDQDVDEDGGWPLEIIDEDGDCFEVYLQPGELVLYEGGRFRHGRPMRLKGNHFANIFSHFAPKGWRGPGKSPKFDGHLDEHGWLKSEEDGAQRRSRTEI